MLLDFNLSDPETLSSDLVHELRNLKIVIFSGPFVRPAQSLWVARFLNISLLTEHPHHATAVTQSGYYSLQVPSGGYIT